MDARIASAAISEYVISKPLDEEILTLISAMSFTQHAPIAQEPN